MTQAQRTKLIKLVGVRYNPDTEVVKMSCESFETQAQNKKYLRDLVNTLIREAKDGTDMFEDIPIDLRHHKRKPVYKYPEEWKLTPRKRQQLLEQRVGRRLLEQQRAQTDQIVDGRTVLEEALKIPNRRPLQQVPLRQAMLLEKAARGQRAR